MQEEPRDRVIVNGATRRVAQPTSGLHAVHMVGSPLWNWGRVLGVSGVGSIVISECGATERARRQQPQAQVATRAAPFVVIFSL